MATEKQAEKKRVFVDGLHQSITETDIQSLIGKYGEVVQVDLITKKSDLQAPGEQSAYVDVYMSDKNLQRCSSIYYKSKWKGGSLSITAAREGVPERLQNERLVNKPTQPSTECPLLPLDGNKKAAKNKTPKSTKPHSSPKTTQDRTSCEKQSGQDSTSGSVAFNVPAEHSVPIMSLLTARRTGSTKTPDEAQHSEQSEPTGKTKKVKRLKSETRRKNGEDVDISHAKRQSPSDKPQRMGLFEDSSDFNVESDEKDDSKRLAPKPQLERKSGEKLLRLQQKIGHDKRFQNKGEVSSAEESSEDEDKLFRRQMKQEKSMELGILGKILGKEILPSASDNTVYNSTSLFQPSRYDPNSEHCQDLELNQPAEPFHSPPPDTKSFADAQEDDLDERFYTVQGSLKEAFSAKQEDKKRTIEPTSTFSFGKLFDSTLANNDRGDLQPASKRVKLPWMSGHVDADQSISDDDSSEMETEIKISKPEQRNSKLSSGLFFFHPENDSLRNRLAREFNTELSLAELNKSWPAMRAQYKQSFRQRRKDALRAKKRLNA